MKAVEFFFARGKVVELSELPPYSIALDGYVRGPALDLENHRLSFDHHDHCIRLVTQATCAQVRDALLLGFDPAGYTAYINDVDGDTVLSAWLLLNPQRVTEKNVRALVETVAAIDAHGPAYPVMQPEWGDAFFSGAMAPLREAKRDVDLKDLMHKCLDNVERLLSSKTLCEWIQTVANDNAPVSAFEITHQGTGWVMVKSEDYAFDKLYGSGYTRAIVYTMLPDGSINYRVGKKSDLVEGFPVGPHSKPGTLLAALDQREPGWGGGTSIGGAPRNPDGSRSHLSPDEVFEIVQNLLLEKNHLTQEQSNLRKNSIEYQNDDRSPR